MRFFLFSIILFFSITLHAEVNFTSFIDTQLKFVYAMNENNITQEEIKTIVNEQEASYNNALNKLMENKNRFIEQPQLYDAEIFSLKKIMSINKRAGNTNAVLRDEIKLKSYRVLRNQNLMIKEILLSLNAKDIHSFENDLNEIVSKNQEKVHDIYSKDYTYVNEIITTSKTFIQAKNNLQEFYALKDINVDMINNIYKLENRMYRLNKYTDYHVIKIVIFINSLHVVETLNPLLEMYGLTVIKIVFILVLIAFVYFFRKIIDIVLKKYILTLKMLNHYSKEIMEKLYRPIDILVVVVNINMVIYVFNDFSSIESISKFFNIIYGLFFTLMLYKVVNTVATIKLSEISDNRVKNEMINVGIKILNFVIILIGVLIALYFAGVNLTAVLSGLGIGGFAVAFAAKDTISNFFGTLSILFSNVFSQGDWIVVGKDEGVVVEIGLRVTTIRTFDNALIAIPNGTFATSDVKNWNRRTLGRRIKMNIGVTYGSKSKDIKNAVNQIREMLDKHSGIATSNTKHQHRFFHAPKLLSKDDYEGVKKTLLVYMDEFGGSSINIMVYCFSKTVNWQEWLEVKEDVMYKIMEILEKNSLEFAFPSLSIYNENQDKQE